MEPKLLRNQIGVSVAVFADLVGCTPGHLSMVESGKRKMPVGSMSLLSKLEEAFNQNLTEAATSTNPDQKTVSMLDKHIRRLKMQVITKKQKAGQLADKLEQANRFIQLAEALDADPLLPGERDMQQRIKIMKHHTKKRIVLYNEEWIRVELAIARLEAEMLRAAELQKM